MKTVAFSILFTTLLVSATGAHPVHISVTNMEIQADSGFVDYSIRLFYEDFQSLINYSYNTQLDFSGRNRLTTKEQEAILDYLGKSFQILTEDEMLLMAEFKGWKMEDQSVSFLFRTSFDPGLNGIQIKNIILLDIFNDQTNLVIIQGKEGQNGWEFSKRKTSQHVIF
ncbi:MAG: hypothetical protein JW801_10260 [Bacteroidales bacterium]|nr:hypothetical protein [Bacteroidales bacterium]